MTIHALYYEMLDTDRLYEEALAAEYGPDALAMRYQLAEQPAHTRALAEEKDRAYAAFLNALAQEGARDGLIAALPTAGGGEAEAAHPLFS